MKPSFHPEGKNFESMKVSTQSHQTVTQLWHSKGSCPKGTIPIRRTKKEDILRASSVKKYGKKSSLSTVAQPNSVDLDLINQSGHQVSWRVQLTNQLTRLTYVDYPFAFTESCLCHL